MPQCVVVTNPVSLHLQQRNSVLNKGQHLPSVMYASWQMPEYFNNKKKKVHILAISVSPIVEDAVAQLYQCSTQQHPQRDADHTDPHFCVPLHAGAQSQTEGQL